MGECIDQRRLPGISRLFADYLYGFAKVRRFYGGAEPRLASMLTAARQYPEDRRQAMLAALERQNQDPSPATASLLRRFAEPGTVAIVTGQQVGVAGGPLLGVHKAMTAVLLAEALRAQGVSAVPVFWLASQDHDLAEVSQLWTLDAASALRHLELLLEAPANAPVGPLQLDGGIAPLLDELARCTGTALDDVRAAYASTATLADAFGALLARWFAPWGLLLFDPLRAPEAEAVWAPYYAQVAGRQPELAERLARRAQELQAAGYHVQVEAASDATLLFYTRDGARQALRAPLDAARRADIARHPGLVSPAALLRPVMQDVAFPTLAQVTGPAETAYLAQSAVIYEALGIPQPVVFPRASVTLLDPKAQRLLAKYQLELPELWAEPAATLLPKRTLPASIAGRVTGMRATFDQEFGALHAELNALDPTLIDAAEGAVQKIRHQLEQLEARVARSLARRGGEVAAHAQHLDATLYPDRHLQERLLAAASWTARYPELLAVLHDQIRVFEPGHQVIGL